MTRYDGVEWFGELWTRAISLISVGGGLLGTPLAVSVGWSHGSAAHPTVALMMSVGGLFVGGVAGLFVGLPVAAVGVAVLRRHPPAWQARRFARAAGVAVAAGGAWCVQSVAQMRPMPFVAFLFSSLMVGWWVSPRLTNWYIDLLDRSGQ